MNKSNLVNLDTPELISWLAGAQKILTDYMQEYFTSNPMPKLEVSAGSKYVRVTRTEPGSQSAHAFALCRRFGIDPNASTKDALKSWE